MFLFCFVSYFILVLELQLDYSSLVEINRTLFTDLYKLLFKYEYPSKGKNLALSLFMLIYNHKLFTCLLFSFTDTHHSFQSWFIIHSITNFLFVCLLFLTGVFVHGKNIPSAYRPITGPPNIPNRLYAAYWGKKNTLHSTCYALKHLSQQKNVILFHYLMYVQNSIII